MEIDDSKYYWKNNLIRLRPPRDEDWEALLPNMFDSEARFLFSELELPVDRETYRQSHVEWLRQEKGFLRFAIENKAGKHVGIANLFGVDERNGVFGPIGIQINPMDRGMGYAVSAYRMLGRYMFCERRMHKWNSAYMEGNAASAALHKKMGFVVEGIRRDIAYHEGRYWNEVLCGVTEAEFFENEKLLPEYT